MQVARMVRLYICVAVAGLLAGCSSGTADNAGDGNGSGATADGGGKGTTGSACTNGATCASKVCKAGACEVAAASCSDGSKDGTESDVDCGGSDCPVCADGKSCSAGSDCDSTECTAGVCVPSGCSNKIQDGAETGIDCGGGCPGCGTGAACKGPTDCASGVCTNGTCAAPSPTDMIKNDSETATDCGGALNADGSPNPASDGAPVCAVGQGCTNGHDCSTGVCATGSVTTPSGDDGGADATDGSANGTSGSDAGASAPTGSGSAMVCQPPSPSDGVMNDSETDVDCGGVGSSTTDGANPCADGLHCIAPADCTSGVCTGGVAANGPTPAVVGVCAVPTCMDMVKNGLETGVDCGGGTCSACAAGLGCAAGTDCLSGTCNYANVCAAAPSCANQYGGDTCGPGETDDPNATHEDCCTSIMVPRPTASGGPFTLDKYLITAGRMRTFLESVNYDVQGYIAAHTPAWWPTGTTATTWNNLLPASHDDFITGTSSDGASGCFIGATSGEVGAPAYWETADDLARVVGGAPRTYTQQQMDVKVMNCYRAPLFHALCAFDGGRLPSLVEWTAARTTWTAAGVATVLAAPWANDGASYNTMADRESHAVYDTIGDDNYFWPGPNAPATNDYGPFLGAPGRFPSGNGPYGHSDLMGSVENMGSRPATATTVEGDGWFQFSFQEAQQSEHPYGQEQIGFGDGSYRPHWAVGARCLKLQMYRQRSP